MLIGQRELEQHSERGVVMGAGQLRLHDWFVPVLYQEEGDAPLFSQLPGSRAAQLQQQQRRLALGAAVRAGNLDGRGTGDLGEPENP